jgi:hypothetical protein
MNNEATIEKMNLMRLTGLVGTTYLLAMRPEWQGHLKTHYKQA